MTLQISSTTAPLEIKKNLAAQPQKQVLWAFFFFVRTFIFCIMCGRICQLTMSQKSLAYFYIANPHIIMNKNSSILWQNKPFFIGFIECMMILLIFCSFQIKKMYILDIYLSTFLYNLALKKHNLFWFFLSKLCLVNDIKLRTLDYYKL